MLLFSGFLNLHRPNSLHVLIPFECFPALLSTNDAPRLSLFFSLWLLWFSSHLSVLAEVILLLSTMDLAVASMMLRPYNGMVLSKPMTIPRGSSYAQLNTAQIGRKGANPYTSIAQKRYCTLMADRAASGSSIACSTWPNLGVTDLPVLLRVVEPCRGNCA